MDSLMPSCPVCTLYLRAGVTLVSHLNTHPKDQVIDALVRLSGDVSAFSTPPPSRVDIPPPPPYHHFNPSYNYPLYNNYLNTSADNPTQSVHTSFYFPNETPALGNVSTCTLPRQTEGVQYSDTELYRKPVVEVADEPRSNLDCDILVTQSVNDSNLDNTVLDGSGDEGSLANVVLSSDQDGHGSGDEGSLANVVLGSDQDRNGSEDMGRLSHVDTDQATARSEAGSPVSTSSNSSSLRVRTDLGSLNLLHTDPEPVSLWQSEFSIDLEKNIGTVISDSQRLIANISPEVVDDMCHQYRTRRSSEEAGSPHSNAGGTSPLRVRQDLNPVILMQFERETLTVLNEVYITSEMGCQYQDEDARDSQDIITLHAAEGAGGVEGQAVIGVEVGDYIVEAISQHSYSVPPLNIETDELMPPRGELSGQESLSNTQNSVWQAQDEDHEPDGDPSSDWVPATNAKEVSERLQYQCFGCSECFDSPKERRAHMNKHHDCSEKEIPFSSSPIIVNYKSPITETIVPDIPDIKTVSITLPIKSPVKVKKERLNVCKLCDLQVSTLKQLRVHNKEEHAQKRKGLQCTTCLEHFPSKHMFKDHLVKVHPLECCDCGKCFFSRPSLLLHKKRHLFIKPFSCETCTKSFITRQKLSEHMTVHTGDTPLKCKLCGKGFRRYSNLIQHKQHHHLKIKKKMKDYYCQCGEVFKSKRKLDWHKEVHEKPKQCLYCSEKYVHYASITRHIRKVHNEEYLSPFTANNNKNWRCPVCGKVCLESSMNVHLQKHAKPADKPYSCIICAKKFLTKWNLQQHKWTHSSRNSKPFKCKLCKSAFIRENDYISHMRSHRNHRPYTCNHCGKQFIRKYNCVRHEREHQDGKVFACDLCTKTFHRKYYLTDHKRTHTGAKPFSCHICNKASATKSNHNKHIRTHHAREPLNTEG